MKKRLRTLISVIALALSFCLILSSCSCSNKKKPGSDDSSSSPVEENITITFSCGESLTMDEWTTVRLTATASDKSKVALTAADSSMLYLRGSSVTALKAGTTTITATAGKNKDVKATLNVTVNAKAENRPELSITGNGDIALGQTAKFGVNLTGVDAADYVVSYSVDDTNIATVDAEGVVTALTSGKTKLKASTTYRSVKFNAEKDITVSKVVKVVFEEDETEVKLPVSAIKDDLTGEYEVEVDNRKYTVDENGEITLVKTDFDLTAKNTFDGKVTYGDNVFAFRLAVYALAAPAVYQDGEKLTPNEDGAFAVDTTKPMDANGLRWVTFDDADLYLDAGYELLKLTVKFNSFCTSNCGIIDSTIAAYHYSFGYKYVEYTDDPANGEDVWLFWDNDYQGQAYGGAMKPAYHAPYGYGYLKIFDAEGKLLLDYYQKQITDASGTHGNWSDYIKPLETGKEYTFLLDISKTHDVSFSGLDDALITRIEWCKKEDTKVTFDKTELVIDTWDEATLNASTNDGSAVVYTVDNPDVLYLDGNRIVGLKEGTAEVTATANGKTAVLNVTVNADTAKTPVVEFDDIELELADTATLAAVLKSNGTAIDSDKYTVAYEIEDETVVGLAKNVISGLTKGNTAIKVTFTYCGKEFDKTITVTVTEPAAPIDTSVGKLYQGGEALAADADGNYVIDASKDDKTLTFDPYATKSGYGYTKVRFTVKFGEITNNHITVPGAGTYSFGYTGGNVSVGWYNSYINGSGKLEGAYVGAFSDGGSSPEAKTYLRVYNAKGEKIFEHYDVTGWSSSHYGYIPPLEVNTEYTFELDIDKIGDVTLYGFDQATFTKIKWVNFDHTEVTFDKTSVEEDEWTEFDFTAISNDGSTVTVSSDNEEVLVIRNGKAIGIKEGTANIVAVANGVTAKLPVTIRANTAKRPVVSADDVELTEGESKTLSVAFTANGVAVAEADYTVAYAVNGETDVISITNALLSALKAGSAEITVTVTYWGQNFTATVNVTVNAAEIPIDYSVGKLFQNGAEITANEDGALVPDATAEVKTLTFDTYATKSGMGYRRIRFTVKFNALTNDHVNVPGAGTYSFGYTYGNVSVGWYNSYTSGSKYEGAYVGAFTGGSTSPNANAYLRIYNADGKMIFEHYDKTGWSSSYYGYIPELVTGTEYTFDIDTEKTGDITLYGFENAVFTEIEWVDYNKVEIAFDKDSVTSADEWEWFGISATTSDDLAKLTFSSDNEEVLVVKGTRAIGIKAGTANILAKNSAGKTVKLPITINAKEGNYPALTAENVNLEIGDVAAIDAILKSGTNTIATSEYTVSAVSSADCVKFENGKLVGVSEGTAEVTVTATYCGVTFSTTIEVTVTVAANPAAGKLYQGGKEIVADAEGNYKVDTTVDGDADGLHWLKVNTAKLDTYTYLRFTVKFDKFVSYKKMTPSQYDYNFGYNYGSATCFYANTYSSGGFGGGLGTDGGANQTMYFNAYTAEDSKIAINAMAASTWTPYYTLQVGVEYIFEFNVKAMGESFTLAGFETATISNITWAESLLA